MKRIQKAVMTTILVFFTSLSVAQGFKFAGTHPPDTSVLSLLVKYRDIGTNWTSVEERDRKRKDFVSTAYFYHGLDGTPVALDSLTKRQTKNELKFEVNKIFDIVIHQYENTALVTYKSYSKGMDKGKPFEGFSFSLVVIGKEGGRWKVISDIIGNKPNIKEIPKD